LDFIFADLDLVSAWKGPRFSTHEPGFSIAAMRSPAKSWPEQLKIHLSEQALHKPGALV